MKTFRPLLLFFFFCISCTGPRAVVDYDTNTEFSQYRTFGILPEYNSGLSELDEKRLIRSVYAGLQKEGLSEATQPDLLVNVYSEEFQQPSDNTLGIGVGGTGGNVGVGISGGIPLGGPENYLTLTFDLIDGNTKSLVWQAVVQSKFNINADPEERQLLFDRMVIKALKQFPPK